MLHTNRKIFKKLFSLTAVLLAVGLTFSSCSSVSSTKKVKIKSLETHEAVHAGNSFHTVDTKEMIYVAKSGLIELYLDTETYGIAIKETSINKTWLSMPATVDAGTSTATILSIELSKDNQIYRMNSQDNSVAFSAASFKPVSNGIQIVYNMALDAESAKNGGIGGVPYASVTVSYVLSDGTLHAKISCSEAVVANGYVLERLTLLNDFGAITNAGENDFILLPDGSGATLMLAGNSADTYQTRSFEVYGSDLSLGTSEENEKAAALFGYYGMKQGNSAFVTLLQSGDTNAEITSYRSDGENAEYRVGASFRITDVVYSGKEGKQTKYIGESWSGEIDLCFRFLSGKNASYSGMAAACRELLIRNSVLSTKTVTTSAHLPFALTLWGAVSKNSGGSYKTLSDYEQAGELLSMMKAKSINNITLRYCGVLDGAVNQYLLAEASTLGGLGKKKDFAALKQYVATQKFEMYLDMDIASFNKRGASGDYARNMQGDKIEITESNPFTAVAGKESFTSYALGLSAVADNVRSYINNTKDYVFDGYAVRDAGKLLYSDYSSSSVQNRSNAVNMLSEQASTLSSGRQLMIDSGNFYMLKDADFVAGLPSETAYPADETYIAVPFVEMILHGIVDYTLSPINLSTDSALAFLKSVEYGALPAYEWYFEKTGDEQLDAAYHYEKQLNAAAEKYLLADAVIGNLRNARMTAHYQVADGVYCTEYNNSILIYFNYNDTAQTVNSIMIEPMSCIRVN